MKTFIFVALFLSSIANAEKVKIIVDKNDGCTDSICGGSGKATWNGATQKCVCNYARVVTKKNLKTQAK